MTKKLVVLLMVLAISAMTVGTSFAVEGWQVLTLKHQINDSTGISVNEETYTNDNWGYNYEHIDLGINYQANSWLNIGANYRAMQQNWKALSLFRNISAGYVSVPYINATIMGKVSGIELYNTFILAYNTGADVLFWWNISGANFPVEMNNGSILIPYVNVQPFIGLNALGLFNLRSKLGVNYKFANTKWIVPGVFYVNEYRNLNSIFNKDYNGVGLEVTLNLQ